MRIKEVLNNRRRNKRRNEQRKSVAKRERARKIREAKLYFKAAKITALIIYGGSFGLEMGYEFGFHEYEMHPFTGINDGLILFKNGLVWSFNTGWDGISWVYETIDNLDRPTYASSSDYDWGDDTYSSEPLATDRDNQSQEPSPYLSEEQELNNNNNTLVVVPTIIPTPVPTVTPVPTSTPIPLVEQTTQNTGVEQIPYSNLFGRVYPEGTSYYRSQEEHMDYAVDYVAGQGTPLISPFSGTVTNIYYKYTRIEDRTPVIVITDDTRTLIFEVYHLDYLPGIIIGTHLTKGDVYGYEGNIGWTECLREDKNDPTKKVWVRSHIVLAEDGEVCGFHGHFGLYRLDGPNRTMIRVQPLIDRYSTGFYRE